MHQSTRHFMDMVRAHWAAGKHLCIGLDTDVNRIPEVISPDDDRETRVLLFNEMVINATCDLVCAYKPNIAFYEALGPSGIDTLGQTIEHIHAQAADVPVIIDAKRADIGSTNEGYVASIFDHLSADAVTVHPYLGGEALKPFLERADKGVLVLARTSNRGAGEFQDLLADGLPLYLQVARAVASTWNAAGNCGLVVGATYPQELRRVRETVGQDMPILVPGIGSQGGDVRAAVTAGTLNGTCALIINASRSVLYAFEDTADSDNFQQRARAEAHRLADCIADALRAHSKA